MDWCPFYLHRRFIDPNVLNKTWFDVTGVCNEKGRDESETEKWRSNVNTNGVKVKTVEPNNNVRSRRPKFE